MKIIVTHTSPDWDAITSVWVIKRYLPGWENAKVEFVPAGEHSSRVKEVTEAIQKVGEEEMIHVDTGLGPLDHHQTSDQNVSAASVSWDFVKTHSKMFEDQSEKVTDKIAAIERIVSVVVATDHFKEVFWENPTADYHEFSLLGLLDGLKLQKPNEDDYYTEFGMACLDAMLHNFENRLWAEKEIEENGKMFDTRFGKGIAFETINDDVLKLAQKMGYTLVARKDPRKGYLRIKARPSEATINSSQLTINKKGIDLTLVYEQLKKMDPEATWFLHVSKKMLLNGTVKNPKMVPTKLTIDEIIHVLEKV